MQSIAKILLLRLATKFVIIFIPRREILFSWCPKLTRTGTREVSMVKLATFLSLTFKFSSLFLKASPTKMAADRNVFPKLSFLLLQVGSFLLHVQRWRRGRPGWNFLFGNASVRKKRSVTKWCHIWCSVEIGLVSPLSIKVLLTSSKDSNHTLEDNFASDCCRKQAKLQQ